MASDYMLGLIHGYAAGLLVGVAAGLYALRIFHRSVQARLERLAKKLERVN